MLCIDGSLGEGGGQVLRTAAALSAVTGESMKISSIRANRRNPGIMPQHLSAINAVAELCDGRLEGAKIGSQELEFIPGNIREGRLNIDVGTAGSVTLVLQALMIPAMHAPGPVDLSVRGGTDVSWSPSIDYLRHVTLPLLAGYGYRANLDLVGRGYYPAGGGRVEVNVEPAGKPRPLNLTKRGRIISVGGLSHAHSDLAKARVSERQMKSARTIIYNKLANMGFKGDVKIDNEYADALSCGSGITLWAETEHSVVGSDALGAPGRRAETVGTEAAGNLIKTLESGAALDPCTGDQIIPYLALAGGAVSVSEMTGHTLTNIDVVNLFGFDVKACGNTIIARRP